MKKTVLILVSSFILMLCGCGNGEQNINTSDSAYNTSQPATESGSDSTTTTATDAPTAADSEKSEAPDESGDFSDETQKPEESEAPEDTENQTDGNDNTTTVPDGYSEKIVALAESLIGTPFFFGGDSPDEGFDGSGLIYYVLRESGYVTCPRLIRDQVSWAQNVGFDDIKAGDVLFYSLEEGGDTAEFGGIYIGNGTIIYSPYEGETVKKADITTGYWTKRFVTAISL